MGDYVGPVFIALCSLLPLGKIIISLARGRAITNAYLPKRAGATKYRYAERKSQALAFWFTIAIDMVFFGFLWTMLYLIYSGKV